MVLWTSDFLGWCNLNICRVEYVSVLSSFIFAYVYLQFYLADNNPDIMPWAHCLALYILTLRLVHSLLAAAESGCECLFKYMDKFPQLFFFSSRIVRLLRPPFNVFE